MFVVNCSVELVVCMLIDCVRVKEVESEQFRIDKGMRQRYIMFPRLLNVHIYAVMKEVNMGMGRRRESGHYLVSRMQMNWLCVVSRRKTWGRWQDVLLRCVGKEV